MDLRRALYASAFVGASVSSLFTVVAFTGSFEAFRWFVFVVVFLGVTDGFERFVDWTETVGRT